MARSFLDAISVAAAELQNATMNKSTESASEKPQTARVQPRVQPRSSNGSTSAKSAPKAEPATKPQPKTAGDSQKGNSQKQTTQEKSTPKAETKTDTSKVKGGASYVISAEFKQAIETYLKSRPDMRTKMQQKGKSLDGCCDYIYDVMKKRAEKARNGKSAVGLCGVPQEIFGLAAHYYDETDEDLKAELNEKEGK